MISTGHRLRLGERLDSPLWFGLVVLGGRMLAGKKIVLGVTGSIAAYKAAILASTLHQAGAQVDVIMTESATKLVAPLTFQSLTGRPCLLYTSDAADEEDSV